MGKTKRYVGMDVHAATIAVAVVEGRGVPRSLGIIDNRPEAISRLLKKLETHAELPGFLARVRVMREDAAAEARHDAREHASDLSGSHHAHGLVLRSKPSPVEREVALAHEPGAPDRWRGQRRPRGGSRRPPTSACFVENGSDVTLRFRDEL